MEPRVLKRLSKQVFRTFSLSRDRPHLKEHLYEGVEAMELPENVRHSIVDAIVSLINRGSPFKVNKIIPVKFT